MTHQLVTGLALCHFGTNHRPTLSASQRKSMFNTRELTWLYQTPHATQHPISRFLCRGHHSSVPITQRLSNLFVVHTSTSPLLICRTETMAWLICDSMDNRVVTFSDNTSWRLTKKLSEKQWKGSATQEEADWAPSEAHAVYECVQVRGPQLGKEAIVKVRIEYSIHRTS